MDGVILHDGDCLHLLNARFWLQVVIQQRPVGIQATDAMDGAGARERRAIIRTKALEYTTITLDVCGLQLQLSHFNRVSCLHEAAADCAAGQLTTWFFCWFDFDVNVCLGLVAR